MDGPINLDYVMITVAGHQVSHIPTTQLTLTREDIKVQGWQRHSIVGYDNCMLNA